MSKFVVGFAAVACAVTLSAFGQNKVVFDNQSGDPALVKLIGPTKSEVQVPNGGKQGVDAAAGKYTIKVRYGTPGSYRYSKGQEFEVTETATAKSETTITLHKVIAGNYDAHPISEAEFGSAASVGEKPTESQAKEFVQSTNEAAAIALSYDRPKIALQFKKTSGDAPRRVILGVEYGKKRRQITQTEALELPGDSGSISLLQTLAFVGFMIDADKAHNPGEPSEGTTIDVYIAMYEVGSASDGSTGPVYGKQVSNVVHTPFTR